MVDLWPNYISMVTGFSRATRARARSAAQALLAQAGLDDVAADAGERVTKLAEEIGAVSRANRELLENLVTSEVDKAATRLGFVRTEDLSEIRAEIAALRAQLIVVMAPATDPAAKDPAEKDPAAEDPAKKAAVRKSTAAKTPGTKSSAPKSSATKTAGTKTAGTKSPGTKSPGTKTATATSATARSATAKSATAKRTTPRSPAVTPPETVGTAADPDA